MQKKKVLISAYACEPGKGSEPAVGWNCVQQMSRHHEVWALTRANNQPVIEASGENWISRVHWVYFDLPARIRSWKKGTRRVQLYYWLWQVGAFFRARKLLQQVRFDLVHHVTFGQFWIPSWLGALGVPFVFGPVGGGEDTPEGLFPSLTVGQRWYELFRCFARNLCRLDPMFRSAARRTYFVAATAETETKLVRWFRPAWHTVVPQFAMDQAEMARFNAFKQRSEKPFRLISIGRLVHWKGYHLSIRAFARLRRQVPDAGPGSSAADPSDPDWRNWRGNPVAPKG